MIVFDIVRSAVLDRSQQAHTQIQEDIPAMRVIRTIAAPAEVDA